MTTLDELDLSARPGPPNLGAPAPRIGSHEHRWRCTVCLVSQEDAEPRARRGRLSDRLGKDNERRIARVYGPRKVGQFGDAIDLLGHDWKWQAKATRADPVGWLDVIRAWSGRADIPAEWSACFTAMAPLRRDLRPLLIRSYVRHGFRTRDWVIVSSSDWAELHGPATSWRPWVVMTGEHFLAINGRDEGGVAVTMTQDTEGGTR